MKLYEMMKVTKEDYDTFDTVYDAEVTVCFIDDEDIDDAYIRFCMEIIKKVDLIEKNGDNLIVDWTKLIRNNMKKFKAFTMEHWYTGYEDDEDEFIYQWIKEIDGYMAGYVSENFYETLVNFVDTLEC